jgi:hypothetical protein
MAALVPAEETRRLAYSFVMEAAEYDGLMEDIMRVLRRQLPMIQANRFAKLI